MIIIIIIIIIIKPNASKKQNKTRIKEYITVLSDYITGNKDIIPIIKLQK